MIFNYKGFEFNLFYSAIGGLFYAESINCMDLISIQAENIPSLKELINIAMENYLFLIEKITENAA